LLITLDTTRVDSLGIYGNPSGHTPNIDRLARRGVVFDNAVAPIGTTFPSHASMFTGRYPRHHYVRSNYDVLPDSFDTLAELLKQAGYQTAAWVSFQAMLDVGGLHQGFDERSGPLTKKEKESGKQRPGPDVNRMALPWLTQSRDAPFFAWLHYFEPHSPYTVTPYASEQLRGYSGPLADGAPVRVFYSLGRRIPWSPEERKAIRVLYDGEVREADRFVGNVLHSLSAAGLDNDTIVVVTADHGQGLGEHLEVGHGFSLWEDVIRVPLIIRDPRASQGRRIEARVGIVDLLPTLLELVDVPIPPGLDGRSLAHSVRGGVVEEGTYFAEVQNQGHPLRRPDTNAVAVYHGHFKSIQQDGRFMTFDLASDRDELFPLGRDAIPFDTVAIEQLATTYYDSVPSVSPRELPPGVEEQLRALGYAR
jgi:arylsulfatase A-like enzyme